LLSADITFVGPNIDDSTWIQDKSYTFGFRGQVTILPMFYEQLLSTQIPNVQKRQSSHQYLFALLGTRRLKAVRKMLMISTTGIVPQ
jgi:hypothetical protein